LGYGLEVNDGLYGTTYTILAGYPISANYPSAYDLTVAADGLIEGRIYSIRWFAYNFVGEGPRSEAILVAMSDDFDAPTGLTKDHLNSSKTIIAMTWNAITAGQTPGGNVLGYVLQVEDSNTGNKWIAFDGSQLALPDQLRASVSGLVTGRDYKFSIAARSFNGIGAWSAQVTYFACQPPQKNVAPWRVTSTVSSITIAWQQIGNDKANGCPVYSYAVFCDDGLGGAFAEVNTNLD
jgi:hypothetical protein